MDSWRPNAYAQPFVPSRRSRSSAGAFSMKQLGNGRFIKKIFQSALLVTLVVTLVINILFILDTSKKLNDDSSIAADSNIVQPVDTQNGGAGHRSIKLVQEAPRMLEIEVLSSKSKVSATVDGATILDETSDDDKSRGIHILVLNQHSGAVMAKRKFDTYLAHEDEAMVLFLNMISNGRVIIFAVKDEGSFQMKKPARELLKDMGSEKVDSLAWRDMWAMVTVKAGKKISESFAKSPDLTSWGGPVILRAEFPLKLEHDDECEWSNDEIGRRRKAFCNKIEGYGSVCSCKNPAPLTFDPEPLEDSKVNNIPVAVIASNRPHYLYRMLRSLLSAPGVNPDMVTVFIDGYYEGPLEVTKLFGLRGIQHTPIGIKNGRITQHFKASITAAFNLFPDAQYAILVEEDLDISPDFFNYFHQTLHLLDEDESLYCISAWNDQGYENSCQDPSLLYRIETMPGLGWLLRKKLYKGELESRWPTPEKLWDWDMWMRTNGVRKDRECIIPDVSRTFHFGQSGLNMNPYFHDHYFKKHSLNTIPNVKLKDVDRMTKDNYEVLVDTAIQSAIVLDHSKSPCEEDFIPETKDKTYVVYIKMEHKTDYDTWKVMAKCFHLWDLDVRGYHKGMWRFFQKGNHLYVVGVPYSPYSKHMPKDVTPIYLQPTKKPEEKKT